MAKGEFHVGPNGPAPCSVDPGNPRSTGCPFGGDSGTDNHFKTMSEAEDSYAKQMEEKGHGLFATAASSSTAAKSLSTAANRGSTVQIAPGALPPALQQQFKNKLDELVADSSYGISVHPKYGFVADSSEGLGRLNSDFIARTGDELDPEVVYEDGSDDEVIRSVYIKELDIEIENQNFQDDMRELYELQQMRADDRREYWR